MQEKKFMILLFKNMHNKMLVWLSVAFGIAQGSFTVSLWSIMWCPLWGIVGLLDCVDGFIQFPNDVQGMVVLFWLKHHSIPV